MIDIFEINNGDLTFRNYETLRIKGLTVKQGSYIYDENIGIDYDFWTLSTILIDTASFQAFIAGYLQFYEISTKDINFALSPDNIKNLDINIDLYKEN